MFIFLALEETDEISEDQFAKLCKGKSFKLYFLRRPNRSCICLKQLKFFKFRNDLLNKRIDINVICIVSTRYSVSDFF